QLIKMKNLLYLLPIILLIACDKKNIDPNKEEWQSLFNGKNLEGWEIKIKGYDLGDNFGETFYVEDSILKVKYDAYEDFGNRFGHLFYKDKFSYYKLKVEYRFVGDQVLGGPEWAYQNS